MILSMRMRNIALIEELSLEFGEGLHVMTGKPARANPSSWTRSIWCWADAPRGNLSARERTRRGSKRCLMPAAMWKSQNGRRRRNLMILTVR
mgnify:CR=1 FL=1